MEIDHGRLDDLRRGHGPAQEHIIDEFVAGRLSRRDFLRRGTMIGLSIPLLGGILEACGSTKATSKTTTSSLPSGSTGKAKAGATIKIGVTVPAAAIDPILIEDTGGLVTLGQVAEFLILSDQHLNYRPWLATSWSPNSDSSIWTFKIRQGVKFNDGTPMTVDDVVYSFQSQCDPKTSGNALSVFGGTLVPDGVVKVDDQTVAFHLLGSDASFPDACSSDNYNTVIVPKNTDFSKYQSSNWPGTGHFMKTSYTPSQGATFVRNPHYWGTPALPKEVQFTYYAEEAAETAALEAGSIQANNGFTVSTSPQLLDGNFDIVALKASTHRELSMRCDEGPLKSNLVRQAIAYTLDRPAIVQALFKGYAQVGNDSPFAPVFKSTDTSVPQRTQNLKLAKQLLGQAGFSRGFSASLLTETTGEIPHFAEIVKSSAAQIGVDINLTIETPQKYYGPGTFGKSDWLDGEMSLVDYGSRAVPNLFLKAPLETTNAAKGTGAWNAAHFNDPTFDTLAQDFIAAASPAQQKTLAGKIERLLLTETPIIFAYFYDGLLAQQKGFTGCYPTPLGQVFLWNAGPTT